MSTHRVRITYGTPDRPVVRYLRWREGRKTYEFSPDKWDRMSLEEAEFQAATWRAIGWKNSRAEQC